MYRVIRYGKKSEERDWRDGNAAASPSVSGSVVQQNRIIALILIEEQLYIVLEYSKTLFCRRESSKMSKSPTAVVAVGLRGIFGFPVEYLDPEYETAYIHRCI